MSANVPELLVAALSGRALARSARRGGLRATVLDAFGDTDTRALAHRFVALPLRDGAFDGAALLDAVAELDSGPTPLPVVYGAGLESAPAVLAELAQRHALCGNDAETVRAVKDPARLFPLLRDLGLAFPQVRLDPPRRGGGWLAKGVGGSGGQQVRFFDPATGTRRHGDYYQRHVQGEAMASALFLADGRRARVIGFNTLWQVPSTMQAPFLYAGAVNRAPLGAPLRKRLARRIDALTAATGLRGLNGLDFVLAAGRQALVLEVNPRPTATCELYDPDVPGGLLRWHLRACCGELPEEPVLTTAKVRAQVIVYASQAWRVPARARWPLWSTDRPADGAVIAPGEPVCSVHAAGADLARVRKSVWDRAATVLGSIGQRQRIA